MSLAWFWLDSNAVRMHSRGRSHGMPDVRQQHMHGLVGYREQLFLAVVFCLGC